MAFTIKSNPDGSAAFQTGGVDKVQFAAGGGLNILTATNFDTLPTVGYHSLNRSTLYPSATASGTHVEFTGIPPWAKKIIVSLDGVSTNGSSQVCLTLGTSSSYETSDYLGSSCYINTTPGGALAATIGTAGFTIPLTSAACVRSGEYILTRVSSNVWVCSGVFGDSNAGNIAIVSGKKVLAAELSRLKVTTVNGTDTFDDGSVSITVEG